MKTYNERLANIKAKAKANQRAKRILAASAAVLSVFVLLIGSILLWPELLFRSGKEPTMGPVLNQPFTTQNGTGVTDPSNTPVTELTKPIITEPLPTNPVGPAPTEPIQPPEPTQPPEQDTPAEPIEQNFDPNQLLELIPADIQEQICQDFNDQFVHFPVYDWEPDVSLRVFGIFGDAYALFVDGHLAYSDVQSLEGVCGITFRYPSTQTMYIYADGQFYSLQEAYDAQLITYEDILAIYKNYKSAYPVYYE